MLAWNGACSWGRTVTLRNRKPAATTPEPTSSAGRLYVAIVSRNPDTSHGLDSYLRAAGVPSHCTRELRDIESVAPECARAAVIFPDDYVAPDIIVFLRQLREVRPRLLALLVTSEPQRFRGVTAADGRSLPPITLPKPSFGWDILDAIRAHAERIPEPI